MAYRLGLEQGDIMNMNSLAGLVGVVFFIIAGQVNRKIGARMTSGICCIISGIAYILACNAPSIVIYTVCMCFVYGGIMSAGYVAGGTLVASWFPKKKGVVMGYTTMGHNFASGFLCAAGSHSDRPYRGGHHQYRRELFHRHRPHRHRPPLFWAFWV